jgi:hypothetical protein
MAAGSNSTDVINALANLLGAFGGLIGACVTAWATITLRKNRRNNGSNGSGSDDRNDP